MKRFQKFFGAFTCAVLMLLLCSSCTDIFGGLTDRHQGTILLSFDNETAFLTRAGSSEIPDTNEFILKIMSSSGEVIYDGKYGAAPQSILANPGSYSVSVRSIDFSVPKFSAPQYGDDKTVVVKSGETSSVSLGCTLLNAGVQLRIASDFTSVYPDGVLLLKSAEGKLMYSVSEKRIAYFKPGNVSLTMSNNGEDNVLFTRKLEARQILVIDVESGTSQSAGSGMRISIDTTKIWLEDHVKIGGGDDGAGDISGAYSVSEVEDHAGESDVWVYGYIVGGDLSSSKCSFKAPFSSRTNFVIAAKSSCTDKASCVSVQLSKGDIRDALNLVDHEEYLGRQIFIKGDIVPSYYGIPGVQNISEYKFK